MREPVYLFSFLPENIQPKIIPNIRYFAPTWCAPFPPCSHHSTKHRIASRRVVWHTLDCFEYMEECNKRRQFIVPFSIFCCCSCFSFYFRCFYFSICVLFHHKHQCVGKINRHIGTNQNKLCCLPKAKPKYEHENLHVTTHMKRSKPIKRELDPAKMRNCLFSELSTSQ